MRKKIVVIVGLIIGLSIIVLSTIQPTSDINEDTIIVNNRNLEVFYFNNLDSENPYNQDFSTLSDKQINQLKKDFIQREVLVREAKRLGLDKIDSIISARLAQLGQQALVGESINIGFLNTVGSFGLISLTFKMLASGQATLKDLGGPIMIGQLAGETAKAGWIPLFNFMALISINLAFLNILPVPGLDGGHIFIILIETIIRRPLSLKSRMVIQQIGMVLLLGLMFTVMFNDIGRLFN